MKTALSYEHERPIEVVGGCRRGSLSLDDIDGAACEKPDDRGVVAF